MSEDPTDEELAAQRRQAARRERQALEDHELYLEEKRQREAFETEHFRELLQEMFDEEQRGQGA